MKFLSIYKPSNAGAPPGKEHMAEMGKLIEESMKSGLLVSTGGLLPLSKGGAVVRRSGGEITLIDAPAPERTSSDFAVLEAKSRDQAVEMLRRFLKLAGDGESELRPMREPGPPPAN
jgi:hypothetical protein